MPQPRLMRIGAGEQRGPRGAAPRIVVELREGEAVFRQRIDIRRRDFTAETAHVGRADVVEQDYHDVRVGELGEIGRATCRGRVGKCGWISVAGVAYKKKNKKV